MAEANRSNGVQISDEGDMTSYKSDALSVVNFKIIYSKDDLQSRKSGSFKPTMAHQVFGESESIFGYHLLTINLYYLHNSSRCYVDVQKSGEIKRSTMYQPDDIMKCLNQWLPEDFTTEKNKFKKMIANETHDNMFGTVLCEFKDKYECKLFPNKKVYATYKVTSCDITDEEFKNFHRRFETFIVWFIDAANFIDLDDERWMIFYVYEEFQHPERNDTYRSPIGFCSVYKFFAYPRNIRARISQFFILPLHQKRGIGTKFYDAVVRKIKDMPEVVDITVEEPTSTFTKIRDLDDCLTVYKDLKDSKIDIATDSMKIFAVMRKHKICKRQCQRIYDILGCYNASKSNQSQYQKYVKSIKNRIAVDIERETRGSKRLCNLDRGSFMVDNIDNEGLIDTEYKRYMEDIEPTIKYLLQHKALDSN